MAKAIDEDRKELGSRPDKSSDVNAVTEETGEDATDDLTALLSRASLNQSQYREFSSPSKTSDRVPVDSPAAHPQKEKASGGNEPRAAGRSNPWSTGREWLRPGSEGRAEIRGSSPAESTKTRDDVVSETRPSPPEHFKAERISTKPRPQNAGARTNRKNFDSTLESRWSVLGRALSGETDNSPGRLIQALAKSVSLPFSFVSSVSGGTGVTTILATLAHCLASQGEKVLLVDAGAVSLFPLFFGAAEPGAGELQNFQLHDSNGHVDTVNRKEPDSSVAASLRPPVDSENGGLVSTIRSAASGSDRLLLDARALRVSDVETLDTTKQFGLVPLVPDLSCVFGLLKFEQALRHRGARPEESRTVFYVLNKFDGSLALHRDIKASLERQLGDRLLPITIRRSDAVSEALADGMTVIDYCPEAGVSEDFLRLAEWLCRRAPTAPVDRDE